MQFKMLLKPSAGLLVLLLTQVPVDANGTHASYITHYSGPQYFGYISSNPAMNQQLHLLGDFFNAVENKTLPKLGGVFFVEGGYQNLLSQHFSQTARRAYPHPPYPIPPPPCEKSLNLLFSLR